MTNFYPTITDYQNATGAMPLLFSIRDSVPFAFTGVLLAIFVILTASEYFILKNRTGRGKILTSLVSSSIIMVILSLFLMLAELVTYMDVIFYAFCSIVFFALYKLSSHF